MNAKLAIYEEVAEFEPIELCRIRNCIKADIDRLKKSEYFSTGDLDREIEIRENCLESIDEVIERMEEEYDPYEWSQVTA